MRSVRLMAGRRPVSAALVALAAAWAAFHFAIFDLEDAAAAENTVHARATLSA